MISKLLPLVFAALAVAQPPASSLIQPWINQLISSEPAAFRLNRLTPQILKSFIGPITVQIERNSYVYRQGAELRLDGKQWTASGANVYWLGLDENVIPPAGQPFYAPFNASYPTFGRITEVMNTLQIMGAYVIRSQTLGVSVGNPLSVMPALGVYNEQAFATIDWSVFQARQHGLRIVAPLTDNYVGLEVALNIIELTFIRITTMEGNSISSDFVGSTSNPVMLPRLILWCFSSTPMQLLCRISRTTSSTSLPMSIHVGSPNLTNCPKPTVDPSYIDTGLSYAEDPTIFAYETGNELGGPIFGNRVLFGNEGMLLTVLTRR